MATRRIKLARSVWTAFLLLFAVRAIAGMALCESYGDHRIPPGAIHAIKAQIHSAHEARGTRVDLHSATGETPSNDRADHVCEEAVFLTGEPMVASAVKWSLAIHAVACSYVRADVLRPAVVVAGVSPQKFAHPPPTRTPLDIAPRLRI